MVSTYARIAKALETFGDRGTTPYRVTADEAQQGHDPKNQAFISLAEAKPVTKEEGTNASALQEHQGDHYQTPEGQPDTTIQLTALLHNLLKGTLLNPNFDSQLVRELIWQTEESILEHQELRQEWKQGLLGHHGEDCDCWCAAWEGGAKMVLISPSAVSEAQKLIWRAVPDFRIFGNLGSPMPPFASSASLNIH